MVYDCVIIGTGPAGVSAALNLKIHNKNFILLGSKKLSERIARAEKISNYPGFYNISGAELCDAFLNQLESMEIEITEGVVNSIMPMGGTYAVMAGNEFYETKSIILCSGIAMTALIPGESELVGRGVSYCATCDGGLYRGRSIAVVCTGERFEHEVRYLAELAKEVHYFPMYKNVGAFSENVIISSSRIIGIESDGKLSAVKLKDGSSLAVDGLFCLRESVALSTLLPGLETENGHIKVDRNSMQTCMPGVFAAGDCVGRPYQYTKAVGDGNIAAHSVIEYLDKNS